MRCKFGHVPLRIERNETLVLHRVAGLNPLSRKDILVGPPKLPEAMFPIAVPRPCQGAGVLF